MTVVNVNRLCKQGFERDATTADAQNQPALSSCRDTGIHYATIRADLSRASSAHAIRDDCRGQRRSNTTTDSVDRGDQVIFAISSHDFFSGTPGAESTSSSSGDTAQLFYPADFGSVGRPDVNLKTRARLR